MSQKKKLKKKSFFFEEKNSFKFQLTNFGLTPSPLQIVLKVT